MVENQARGLHKETCPNLGGSLFFMSMEEQRIYTDATISKSMDGENWETDEHGNPVIIIEASNENLDYDGERVLRDALMGSKDYFLQNGVVSFDHKHIPGRDKFDYDPDWNAEKYILGKPLDAWEGPNKKGVMTVFVKAALARSNSIAKEIIGKLRDGIGTVFASVGGRKVKKEARLDTATYRDIPTIVGVDWDEIALTYKPVNQTLGNTELSYPPSVFVKSLTAGSSANPYSMGSGGNTLQAQSLGENAVDALKEKFKGMTKEEIAEYLEGHGLSRGQSKKVLGVLVNKSIIGETTMAENDVNEDVNAVESSTDELLKAITELGDGELSKAKKMEDGDYTFKGGYGYMKKADGTYEKMDDDAPDFKVEIETDDDEDEDEKTSKSLDDPEFIDATEDVLALKKSVRALEGTVNGLASMLKSMQDTADKQSTVMTTMAKCIVEDSAMIKSIHGAPAPRTASVKDLKTAPRFQKSQLENLAKVDSAVTLIKSMVEAGIDGVTQSRANTAFRRGGIAQVARDVPQVAKLFIKEAE